jgi:hypothetical protein
MAVKGPNGERVDLQVIITVLKLFVYLLFLEDNCHALKFEMQSNDLLHMICVFQHRSVKKRGLSMNRSLCFAFLCIFFSDLTIMLIIHVLHFQTVLCQKSKEMGTAVSRITYCRICVLNLYLNA